MKKLLENLLAWHAKRILAKYKPDVIGITGSVGKTSAKEAIFTVLSTAKNVRKNRKNYNNEIGVPLSIIDAETGGKNPFKWAAVFLKAWSLLLMRREFPEVLILEMGADHPGDILHLTKIARPTIGIVTAVGDLSPVHVEFFSGPEGIVKEKSQMVRRVLKGGHVILNIDDKAVAGMKSLAKADVLTVGFGDKAEVQATDVKLFKKFTGGVGKEPVGSTFKLQRDGNVVPVFLPEVLGQYQMYSALFAAAVGILYEVNLLQIVEALRKFDPPKGRMRLVDGIKRTQLIDDTYNSSPLAAQAAVEVLGQAEASGRKIAVLGTMAELGSFTEKAHADLGKWVVKQGIDYLATTGVGGRMIANAAVAAGMNEDRVSEFEEAGEAGRFVQELMKEGESVVDQGFSKRTYGKGYEGNYGSSG